MKTENNLERMCIWMRGEGEKEPENHYDNYFFNTYCERCNGLGRIRTDISLATCKRYLPREILKGESK